LGVSPKTAGENEVTFYIRCLTTSAALFGLSGCVSSAYIAENGATKPKTSFCEIAENLEKYKGVEVELTARYVSDGKHEEALESVSCGSGRRIIDIGRRGGSESVQKFYAARKKICSDRGALYLCNTSADVDMLGTINLMSGELVLDVQEVRRFAFR
jgi:hypothetical protein